MKRFTTTLTAATMAGALAFAAVPQAGAQAEGPAAAPAAGPAQVGAIDPRAIEFLQNPPELIQDQLGDVWRLVNGDYVKTEIPADAPEAAAAPKFTLNDNGEVVFEDGTNPFPENPAPATDPAALEAEEAPVSMPALNMRCGETIWYRTGDGKHYVTDQARVNGALPKDGTQVRTAAEMEAVKDQCAFVEGMPVATPEGLTPGQIAGIAGAAVAVPLIIGGIAYWLNKDGQTLVSSQERVNAEPTPQERAESDRLRAEHAAEIAAQQVEQASDARGIAAETGSNTLARTLFALALATMLGAAAFVAGRRFLV